MGVEIDKISDIFQGVYFTTAAADNPISHLGFLESCRRGGLFQLPLSGPDGTNQ